MNKEIKIELPSFELSDEDRNSLIEFYSNKIDAASKQWLKDIYTFLKSWIEKSDELWLHTSGSTGKPKEILVKKSTMIFSAQQTIQYFQFKKGENWLLCLPASFVGGQMMIVRAICCGANIFAVEPKLDLPELKGNFDFASMIPMQAENYSKKHSELFIDRILIGGASIPSQMEKQFQKNIKTQFFASYGMTETVSHIALRKVNGEGSSSFFKSLKNILLGSDDRNCLTIYHKQYAKNVIITNDLVEFDSSGNFRILGRIDNIINSGGLKIIPEELENEISQIISDRILFIGIPDEFLGQRLILLIEANEYDATTLTLLKNHLAEKFGKQKSPKEIVFIDQFIETSNGKLDRIKTQESYLKNRFNSF